MVPQLSVRRVPRLIYLVIDGGADKIGDETSFEIADTPVMDSLAERGVNGVMYVVDREVAPESDLAVFSLLGYNPEKYYVGRGATELYGLGERLKADYEIALRGNLATIDSDGKIIDRRCGRDISSEEAKKLIEGSEYMNLGIYEGYARTYVGVGYRLVVVIGSEKYKLSDNISNTDPAYVRVGRMAHSVKDFEPYPVKASPLDSSLEARVTAELVNKYVDLMTEHLKNHPLNDRRSKEGKLPCNTVLLRDPGVRPSSLPLFKHLHDFRLGAIVEMPVEKGIAHLTGLSIAEVPPPSRDKARDYVQIADKTIEFLEYVDAMYVHLKGPDIYGHDGDKAGKAKSIELVDKYFLGRIVDKVDLNYTSILITCDHATPPSEKGHTADPVPVSVYIPMKRGDEVKRFSENEFFKSGGLGVIDHGWDLIPLVKRLIWGS